MGINKNSYDVIIVGGGAVGAATLFSLAKQGHTNTLLIDKNSSFGRGSTGSWGSLIRVFSICYKNSKLALEALPHFLNFEEETGEQCYFNNIGCLYFFPSEKYADVHSQLQKLKKLRPSFEAEIVCHNEGPYRFPQFQWFEGDFAVYEKNAGNACPTGTTNTWVDYAVQRGASAKNNVSLEEFIYDHGKIVGFKDQNGEKYYTQKIVITAGPWVNDIASKLNIELPIYPLAIQINKYKRPKNPLKKDLQTHPLFLDYNTTAFGLPINDGQGSFYGGVCIKKKCDSYLLKRPMKIHEANEAKRRLSQRLSWLRTASLYGGLRAIECYTENFEGIVQYADEHQRVIIGTGWSCSGFTLAPVYGKQIAQMCEVERPPHILPFKADTDEVHHAQ